jgi:hypothetical protein
LDRIRETGSKIKRRSHDDVHFQVTINLPPPVYSSTDVMNRRKSVSNLVLCKYINVNVCRYCTCNVCGIDTIQEIKLQITCKLTNVKSTVPSLQREHQSSSLLPILIFMGPYIVVGLSRNTNKMQLCNIIYYSKVY